MHYDVGGTSRWLQGIGAFPEGGRAPSTTDKMHQHSWKYLEAQVEEEKESKRKRKRKVEEGGTEKQESKKAKSERQGQV